MKVTFCSWDKPDYCVAQNIWLKRLLPELRRYGIESQVLFFTIGQPEECPTVLELKEAGFICHATANLGSTDNFVRWILRKIVQDVPDVFIPQHVLPAYFAGRWVREAGVPTVGVLHSEDLPCQGFIEQFGDVDNPFHVTSFVAVSEYIAKIARDRIKKGIQISEISCGTPVPPFIAQYSSRPFRLIYVGRLVEEAKRISEVTLALCRAVREIPNVEAVIYGEGPARHSVKKILSKEAKGLPIMLKGAVENNMIQEILAKCQGFVLLSDYEGTPISLMEAMACGVVPICLNIRGGVEQLIEDGVTGRLVNDRSDSFVAAIRHLVNNPEVWHQISMDAQTKIKKDFSIEVTAKQWENFLRNLHQKLGQKKSIKMPLKLNLPPVHPKLTTKDPRKPSYVDMPALIRHRVKRVLWLLNRGLKSR